MSSQNFEQMVNIYHGIYVYCGIAAIVFLILAAVLFVLLKIPRIFSELTGRGAKKAIQEMVEEGTATGNLTSRKIGEDGRRHRKKAKTGALGTARLRRRTGLTGSLTGNGMGTAAADSVVTSPAGAAAAAAAAMPQNAIPISSGAILEPASGALFASESGMSAVAAAGGYGGAASMNMSENYGAAPADVLNNYGDAPTDVLNNYGDAPTDVLNNYGGAPTDVLNNYGAAPAGALNNYGAAPADVLNSYGSAAMDMTLGNSFANSETMVMDHMPPAGGFMVLRSIVEIHTDEVI